jgi:arsenate reductase
VATAAEPSGRARVLFLCTHNSARSQMAEGLVRHLAGDRFDAMSAGTEATHVRHLAVRAMEEIGVDISGQESKTLDRYLQEPFDYVITVCDDANEACPFFPGAANRLHWSFEDPSKAEGSEEERLAVFRSVRDKIRQRIEDDLVATDVDTPTSYSDVHKGSTLMHDEHFSTSARLLRRLVSMSALQLSPTQALADWLKSGHSRRADKRS